MNDSIRVKLTDDIPLRLPQAAELLGVSNATLRKWVFERRFRFIRVSSRAIRFRVSDIQDFLNSRIVQPLDK